MNSSKASQPVSLWSRYITVSILQLICSYGNIKVPKIQKSKLSNMKLFWKGKFLRVKKSQKSWLELTNFLFIYYGLITKLKTKQLPIHLAQGLSLGQIQKRQEKPPACPSPSFLAPSYFCLLMKQKIKQRSCWAECKVMNCWIRGIHFWGNITCR